MSPGKGAEIQMSPIRVLLVDDSPDWQKFVRKCLEVDSEVSLAGLASDAAEGIRKAKELQPDLIILDVGLPGASGIEAAQDILKVSPKSAILMLSCETDPRVVQAALRAGARGYVLKTVAANDLLAGIASVLRGKRFLSRGLGEWESPD